MAKILGVAETAVFRAADAGSGLFGSPRAAAAAARLEIANVVARTRRRARMSG
jgi:hypothetical protein